MPDWSVAIILGVAIGVLSGLFGIGGSSISTPLLRIALGTPRLIALASPLPTTLPVALSGSIGYQREGLINARIAAWTAAAGVPTVILGALLTRWVPGDWLLYGIAVTVLLAGARLLANEPGEGSAAARAATWSNPPTGTLLATAAVVGLLSGLLANGGGFLLVPAFVLLFGARVRQAAATSLPCVAVLSVPGTIVHAALGHIDGWLALELSVGAVPATYLGAFLSLRLQNVRLRRPFGVFMVIFGIYFFIRELIKSV